MQVGNFDTRAKLKETLRIVRNRAFAGKRDLALHIFDIAHQNESRSAFRRPVRDLNGNTQYVGCGIDTILRRIGFCEELGLIAYDDGLPSLLPYEPVITSGKELDALIEKRLLAYLEKHGAPISAIKHAIRTAKIRDAESIRQGVPHVRLGKQSFRENLHLLSQVGDKLRPKLGKTYYYNEG